MFKKVLTAALAALLINVAAASPARALGAQDAAAAALKVKESVAKLGTGPAARAEVKLKTGAKLKGYVAAATDEHFTLIDPDGKLTQVAYADVERVKAVKPERKKFDRYGLIGASLIGGIFLLGFVVASQTK
jgi:hypothetical protein